LRQGTLATYRVLEAMRRTGVRQVVFASSSVVYGEAKVLPTPEDYGPLFPISLYGASKLACEGLISAFCHNYDFQAWIFRFANVCGRHGTHGAIVDFIRKLQQDSRQLEILGDGRQAKPYLHVSECVDGILYGWRTAQEPLNCFNLGCEGATNAEHIARLLLETMDLGDVGLVFTGGERGWPGDVPQVRLDCTRLARLGWRAKLTSDEAVKRATEELVEEISCKQSS
jgi:UDP-glucose 4-epimerase